MSVIVNSGDAERNLQVRRATRIAYGERGDGGEGGEDWRRETGDASGDVGRETEDEGVIEGWGEIVAATVDVLTNATTYAYDAMNRVAAITNALGDATVYEYDHRDKYHVAPNCVRGLFAVFQFGDECDILTA